MSDFEVHFNITCDIDIIGFIHGHILLFSNPINTPLLSLVSLVHYVPCLNQGQCIPLTYIRHENINLLGWVLSIVLAFTYCLEQYCMTSIRVDCTYISVNCTYI